MQAKALIDKIIQERSKGNPSIANITKTKLVLKGINVDKLDPSSPSYDASLQNDATIIAKLHDIAKEMNITL